MTKRQLSESRNDKAQILNLTSRMNKANIRLMKFILNGDDETFRSNSETAKEFRSTSGLSEVAFFASVVRLRRLGCIHRVSKGVYKINELWL